MILPNETATFCWLIAAFQTAIHAKDLTRGLPNVEGDEPMEDLPTFQDGIEVI